VDFVNEAGESAAILDPTLYGLIQDPGTWNVSLGWVIPGTNPATPRNPLAPFNHPRGVSPFDIDYINPAGRHEHVGVHFYGCDFAAPVAWQWSAPLEYTLMPAFRSTRLPAGQYSYNAYTHGYVQRRNFPVMVPPAGWADIEADLIQGGQIRVWMEFRHEAQATRFNGFVRVEAFDSNDNFVGASIYGQAQPNFYTLLNTAPAGGLGGTGGYLNYTWLGDHKKWRGAAQGADFGLWNATSLEAMNIFPSSTGDADSPGYPFNTCGAGPGGSGLVGNWACPITGQRAFTSSYMYASRNVPLGIGRPIPQDRGINYFVLPWWTQNINANNTWAGWPGWHAVSGLPAAVMPAGQTVNLRGTHHAAANRLEVPLGGVEVFDVYGFYWYWGDRAVTWAGGWPTTNGWDTAGFAGRGSNYWAGNAQWDHGLAGSVNVPGWEGSGAGTYTIKVWAFDARGPNNASERVPWSDDWRMYQMGWEVSGLQVPWGGAAEVWITMNAMATLRGTIRWFDMFGNLRPLPWAMISATNPDTVAYSSGYGAVQTGVSDSAGSFIMWLPEGEHDVSVSTSEAPQAWSSAPPTANAYYKVVVTDGWVGGGDTQLSGSGTPIPELPSFVVPLGLFAALAASAWLLRKRNLNLPVLMN
jgi:hypothetical protein